MGYSTGSRTLTVEIYLFCLFIFVLCAWVFCLRVCLLVHKCCMGVRNHTWVLYGRHALSLGAISREILTRVQCQSGMKAKKQQKERNSSDVSGGIGQAESSG